MSVHSIQRKRRRDCGQRLRVRQRCMGEQQEEFLSRICKTLYYGRLPVTDRPSLAMTEVAVELFSSVKLGHSLDRLNITEASEISRQACISPTSLVLALLYLDRLKLSSPQYLRSVTSARLFLVSALVASKYLSDDGEEDEVLNSEWAVSADIPLMELNQLEKEFLDAIDWEIHVGVDEFVRRLEELEEETAVQEVWRRSSSGSSSTPTPTPTPTLCTYTELYHLLNYIDSGHLAHTLISVGAVCVTAYAASVVSILSSTLLLSTLHTNLLRLLLTTTTMATTALGHHTHSDPTITTPLPLPLPLSLSSNLCSTPPTDIHLTPTPTPTHCCCDVGPLSDPDRVTPMTSLQMDNTTTQPHAAQHTVAASCGCGCHRGGTGAAPAPAPLNSVGYSLTSNRSRETMAALHLYLNLPSTPTAKHTSGAGAGAGAGCSMMSSHLPRLYLMMPCVVSLSHPQTPSVPLCSASMS